MGVVAEGRWHSPVLRCSGGSPSTPGKAFFGGGKKKNPQNRKRFFFKASLPALPVLSRFAAVRWVTVTDRRESSAAAAPEQTAAVIRLEM